MLHEYGLKGCLFMNGTEVFNVSYRCLPENSSSSMIRYTWNVKMI